MCIGCVIVLHHTIDILMLINHPTDGATRGLTLRVRLLGQIYKIKNLPTKVVERTVR